jgi:hypothetical protein
MAKARDQLARIQTDRARSSVSGSGARSADVIRPFAASPRWQSRVAGERWRSRAAGASVATRLAASAAIIAFVVILLVIITSK